MSERHSSSQIPLPPQVRAARFAERKLQPLSETISGLPVYGNLVGKRFTANLQADNSSPFSISYRLDIDEVAPDRKGYRVSAEFIVSDDSVYVNSAGTKSEYIVVSDYTKPPREWRGLDFFSIILEYAKKVARANGKPLIECSPANDELAEFFGRHGFVLVSVKPRKMAYKMDSATA